MAFVASSTNTSAHASSRAEQITLQTMTGGTRAMCHWTTTSPVDKDLLPRKHFATNALSGKGIDILLFGGMNSSGLMSDLWAIDSATMQAELVSTKGEGPSARSSARALLVGNAFIVFGGTSGNPAKKEDSSLWLLNTISKTWSLARITGKKPSARLDHTFCLIGSKVFVFGGKIANMDAAPANDLWAFDINNLFVAEAQWEQLVAEDTHRPESRFGHSAVVHHGKLYVYGGTNGHQVFSDVWVYDPVLHAWEEVAQQGFLPTSRCSHNAVMVAGLMFVFGGIDGAGTSLQAFAAFNIATSYWHRFEPAEGAWPHARSSHAMTVIKSKIFLFGGDIVYPHNSDRSIHVVDVATMQLPEEKPGFSTTDSDRAQLSAANLYQRIAKTSSAHTRGDFDSMSISDNRSIKSIRTDLGRKLNAALGPTNSEFAMKRVFSKTAQDDKGASITAADIRELDKYCNATIETAEKRPITLKSSNSRAGSVLNYFKRRRGSRSGNQYAAEQQARHQNKLSITLPMVDNLTTNDQVRAASALRSVANPKSQQALDLERFLSLEREIYKKYPDYGMPAKNYNELRPLQEQSIPDIMSDRSVLSATVPAMHPPQANHPVSGRVSSSAMERVRSYDTSKSAGTESALERDTSDILRRLGVAQTDVRPVKNSQQSGATDGGKQAIQLSEAHDRTSASAAQRNTSYAENRVLLNALTVLRQELLSQRKVLVADKEAAKLEATTATTNANKSAQEKLDALRNADLSVINALKDRAEALAASEAAVKQQLELVNTQKQDLSNNVQHLQAVQEQSTQALKNAESSLEKYVTMEAEAAELTVRQASQAQMLKQLTIHIGGFQLRATDAERRLVAETYRCNESEKEVQSLKAHVSDLQLQVKQIHRLSSLAKYNWQNSVEEAEQVRGVMLSGLQKLLAIDSATTTNHDSGVLPRTSSDINMKDAGTAAPAQEEINSPSAMDGIDLATTQLFKSLPVQPEMFPTYTVSHEDVQPALPSLIVA